MINFSSGKWHELWSAICKNFYTKAQSDNRYPSASNFYTKTEADSRFSNIVSKIKVTQASPNDLLYIDVNGDYTQTIMQTSYVGTENASTLVNSPVSSGAFYAVRDVYTIPNDSYVQGRKHILVELKEIYPIQGRTWTRMYDTNANTWRPNTWSESLTNTAGYINIPFSHSFCWGVSNSYACFFPSNSYWCQLGTSGNPWYATYSRNYPSVSDRRLKENITYDFVKLANVFAKLKPCSFNFVDDDKKESRIGFIAQEVIAAMEEEGLDIDDYSFVKKETLDEESEMAKAIGDTTAYFINYNEFIALNTYMIQQQQNKIDDLEARIAALEDK